MLWCSTFPLLFGCCWEIEYYDFSQDEKERTACKAEWILTMTPIFTQNNNLGPFWLKIGHSRLQRELNWQLIPAPSIHKTSLNLMKTKRKKLSKNFLTDWIFQKLKMKFFLLLRNGNSTLFYWIKHTSESLRKIFFRENITFAKISKANIK